MSRAIVITVVFLSLVSAGCKQRGDWEKSRNSHCDQVEQLRAEVSSRIESIAAAVEKLPPNDSQCRGVYLGETREFAHYLRGFGRGASALIAGGTDLSTDGISQYFGADPILKAAPNCHNHHEDARKLREGAKKAVEEIDRALAGCKDIGWKSSLAN